MKQLFAFLALGCHAPVVATQAPPAPAKTVEVKPSVEVRSYNTKVPPVHSEWLVVTLPSAAAGATITAALEKSALESAKEFIEMTRKAKADRDAYHMVSPDEWDMKSSCRATMLRASLVSVNCEEYQYSGGAHGNSSSSAWTWSIAGDTATLLSLGDLFVEPWMPTIDQAVIESLRRQEATWVVDGSLQSVAQMLHTWNVRKDGVSFSFDPYEAGPYVQGPMEALVGWTALAAIRRRPGPLDSVAPGS